MHTRILNSLIVASLLAALAITPAEAQAAVKTNCQETQGKVIAVEIPTTILSETVDANVYLPACYDSSDQRYAVLYLLHGLGNNASQWASLGAPAAADQMSTQFIIVMPHDRLESAFDAAFVNEIVPFIDENFRTVNDRNARAIGGLSYGGGWAIHIGLSRPDLFSRIGGHSPALFYGDSPNLLAWARQLLLNTLISIDIGDGDPMLSDSAAPIDMLLTEAGAQHTFNIYAGGHSEEYWATHIGEYLNFYTTGW